MKRSTKPTILLEPAAVEAVEQEVEVDRSQDGVSDPLGGRVLQEDEVAGLNENALPFVGERFFHVHADGDLVAAPGGANDDDLSRRDDAAQTAASESGVLAGTDRAAGECDGAEHV